MLPKLSPSSTTIRFISKYEGFDVSPLQNMTLSESNQNTLRDFFIRISGNRSFRHLSSKGFVYTCLIGLGLSLIFAVMFFLMFDLNISDASSKSLRTARASLFCFVLSIIVAFFIVGLMGLRVYKLSRKHSLLMEYEILALEGLRESLGKAVSVLPSHRKKRVMGLSCFPIFKFAYTIRTENEEEDSSKSLAVESARTSQF